MKRLIRIESNDNEDAKIMKQELENFEGRLISILSIRGVSNNIDMTNDDNFIFNIKPISYDVTNEIWLCNVDIAIKNEQEYYNQYMKLNEIPLYVISNSLYNIHDEEIAIRENVDNEIKNYKNISINPLSHYTTQDYEKTKNKLENFTGTILIDFNNDIHKGDKIIKIIPKDKKNNEDYSGIKCNIKIEQNINGRIKTITLYDIILNVDEFDNVIYYNDEKFAE